MAPASGSSSSNDLNDMLCQAMYETNSIVCPLSVEQSKTVSGIPNSSNGSGAQPSSMVDPSGQPIIWFAPIPSSRALCDHNGCLLSWLGQSTRKTQGNRPVDDSGSIDI
jgi:hypothetical protein